MNEVKQRDSSEERSQSSPSPEEESHSEDIREAAVETQDGSRDEPSDENEEEEEERAEGSGEEASETEEIEEKAEDNPEGSIEEQDMVADEKEEESNEESLQEKSDKEEIEVKAQQDQSETVEKGTDDAHKDKEETEEERSKDGEGNDGDIKETLQLKIKSQEEENPPREDAAAVLTDDEGANSEDPKGSFQLEDPVPAGQLSAQDYINGVVFKAKYLGSTHLLSSQRASRSVRMTQAHEAVSQVKLPDGESQPKTDILLFVSTKRISVFTIQDQILLMDHPLKAISYIADINNSLVLMARRRYRPSTGSFASTSDSVPTTPVTPSVLKGATPTAAATPSTPTTPSIENTDAMSLNASGEAADNDATHSPSAPQAKIVCHVFESEAANGVSKAIGRAFDVAYHDFIDTHGIDEDGLAVSDYADVMSIQKVPSEDLKILSDKNAVKEVIVKKQKGEILGVVLMESGWGSMIPTVVIAHMARSGPLARTGRLNVGDQILSLNGTSLVGLNMIECVNIVKACKILPNVSLKIASCPAVTQVSIFRPDLKYQLGFSVQGTVVCTILRGGIAERGGLRVGHQIIEINGISTVDSSHQRIVDILSAAMGEIKLKTMAAFMYRLLTGQEMPQYI